MGEVYVNIDVNGRIVRGRAVSTDIIEASAKAYLNAINKVVATKPKYAHIEVKNKDTYQMYKLSFTFDTTKYLNAYGYKSSL